jgi:dTDP-4-amino-4,6-dideoxygalactose transaminase
MELAIFSGIPAFEEKLYVGRPNIGNKEAFLEKMSTILDNRWLTNHGPFVQEFENRLRQLLGAKHCIPLCNATIALEIVIRALGMSGEVIIPSLTFVATAHCLQWQEITPVFCDIDPHTHNIDPSCLERLITPKTTGIIGVHLWGRPAPVRTLAEISRKYDLRLVFDAAHAFGCSSKGTMIGNFGDAEVFSFHATKFLNTFEGGVIATNNDDLAEKIRLMKNFGFAGFDRVIYLGTNGKMNEASAAMGITGLESMEDFIYINRRNYHAYRDGLRNIAGVQLVSYDENERNNFQYIVFELDEDVAGIKRDTLISILHAENVIARRYFYPCCHKMEPYASYFPHAHLLLPHTEYLAAKLICLPTGTAIETSDIDKVCEIIRTSVSNGLDIMETLKQKRSA